MNIIEASHESSVLKATLAYLEMGLSVVPVRGKVCPIQWAKFQTELPPFSYVHNWHRNNLMTGTAIVCGEVSGGLRVMDLDGLEAVAQFECEFPYLLDTFTVVTGSGNGKHYYYYTDEPIATTRTKGYELRSDGCYVVAPPSLHPVTGKPYIPNKTEIKRNVDLRGVMGWIRSKIVSSNPAPVRMTTPLPAIKKSNYGTAALNAECENVRTAPQGMGNNVLNRAAFKMGQLVAGGIITYTECESALRSAAAGLSERDGEHATLKTIRSGLNAGMMKAPVYRRG
jgi:hypothetical protein